MGTVQIAQEHVLPLYDCWIGVCVQNFGVHIFVKESSGCPPWGSHFRISADLNTPGRTWPGRGWESRPWDKKWRKSVAMHLPKRSQRLIMVIGLSCDLP